MPQTSPHGAARAPAQADRAGLRELPRGRVEGTPPELCGARPSPRQDPAAPRAPRGPPALTACRPPPSWAALRHSRRRRSAAADSSRLRTPRPVPPGASAPCRDPAPLLWRNGERVRKERGPLGFFLRPFWRVAKVPIGERPARAALRRPSRRAGGGGHRSPGGVACGRVKKEEFNFPQFYQILLKKRFCRTKRYCKDEILRQTVKFAVISGFIPIRQLFPFIY